MRGLLAWIPVAAGTYAFVGGLLTIFGWAFDLPRLADWDGDGIAMQPNTAVSAILAGLALIFAARNCRQPATGFGLFVAALGATTLLQHAFGLHLGIDEMLLFDRQWGSRGTVAPGRMGVPAAMSWCLTGIALTLVRFRKTTHAAVPIIGLVVTAIAGLSLIGYLFGADTLYTLPRLTAIAFQTATILFSVGLALVAIAPDREPLRTLTGDSSASALARWALPAIVILPVALGFFCAKGERARLYDGSMAVAILVLALIFALCAVLWWAVSAIVIREQSLRGTEERFSRFMQHLPGLAWIKDQAGKYLYANEAATKVFGVTQNQLYGKSDDDIFPKDTAAQFRENDRAVLTEGKGVQVIETLKHDDGVTHHSLVSKFPISGSNGVAPLIGGMAIDITDRKRAEETVSVLLRISERLNSTLSVDGLLDILVQEAISLVGAESGVAGLLAPEGMVSKRYFQKGRVLPLDYCWPPMHGLPGWLIVNRKPYLTNDAKADAQIIQALCEQFGVQSALSTPILNAQGEVIGFFEIHNKRDASGFMPADQEILLAVSQSAAIAVQNALAYRSLKQAEESLQQVDRRKNEFLATLAHELRNPLAPIRTGLDIIEQAPGDAGAISDAQRAISRQVSHLVRLVDDLLDISRITRDKLDLRTEPVSLASIIRHAVETSRSHSGSQTITLALPDRPVYLDADPVRLTQVFTNLLNNACKFSRPETEIVIAARCEKNEVAISVKDAGIGIPPDRLEHVFDMFTQVHQSSDRSVGGLGIGLTLAKRLVEMHGGTIVASSGGVGCGSEFVVRLPSLVEAPATASARKATTPVTTSTTRRVLIVDDNRDAAAMLKTLMKLMGHETALAHDGVEAAEMAETYRPQVILLDIGLPKMNGYETCRAIRQQPWGGEIVIVALTGWGQEEDRRQSFEAGFDGHLVKPVDHDALVKLLEDLTRARTISTTGLQAT